MTESNESPSDRAIREALESVERIERESKKAPASPSEDEVEILSPGDGPPSASAETTPPAEPQKKKSVHEVMLEATLKAKQEMQEVLSQTQKEAKDLFDRLARVSADFDNFKKRVNREKADAIKFANEGVFKEMLPVLDNLLRAVAAGEASDGVKLVARQYEDALAKFGVVGFPSAGMTFDPGRHEAVGSRPDAAVPANHVAEEYQRGYMLHDRLLRPALVIVSSGAPAEN
ncbi:MAG TPA: nucleotide exchange factor GrpE [Myxococcota bacterium]